MVQSASCLYLFQFGKIHAQPLLPNLPLELNLNELGILLHLAFQNRPFAKFIVPHFIARLVLLLLWLRRLRCRLLRGRGLL